MLKEDVIEEILYVLQISKDVLLIFLTKELFFFLKKFIIFFSFLIVNNEKVLLNLAIANIVTFIIENDFLKVKFLTDGEKSCQANKDEEFFFQKQIKFLKFSSFEIRINLDEEKKKILLEKFKECSDKQYFIDNKINVFKFYK